MCYIIPMRTLLVALLLVIALPAYGSIIIFSSGVTVLPTAPPSLMAGQLLSDTTIYGFSEETGVVLSAPVHSAITSPGTWICCSGLPSGNIGEGVTVNSYLLRASPETDVDGFLGRDFQGSITFSPGEKIIGIIVGYQNIANTDGMLGAPGTVYPPISYNLGGLETGDEVVLSGNRQTVYVNFHVSEGNMDMIRILTQTPEPADFVLLGSGLVALAFFRRRLGFGARS